MATYAKFKNILEGKYFNYSGIKKKQLQAMEKRTTPKFSNFER